MFSLTITISTCLGSVLTLFTGLTFANKPSSFLSLTIGLEYPSTLCEGEETAPNMASPVHSFFRASTVAGGRATPVFWKCSNPASRWMKEVLGIFESEEAATASMTLCAACVYGTSVLQLAVLFRVMLQRHYLRARPPFRYHHRESGQ